MSGENVSSSQVPTPVPIQVPPVPAQAPSLPANIDLRHSYILPDPIDNVFGVLGEISCDDIDVSEPYKLYFSATFEDQLFRVKVRQYLRADGQTIVKFHCQTLYVNAEFNAFLDRVLLRRLRNNGIMRLDGSALPSRYQPRLESSQ